VNVVLNSNPMASAPAHTTGNQGNGRLALALGVAGALATALSLPYSNRLLPGTALTGAWAAGASVLQGALVLALGWAGLRMGQSLGLDSPKLRALVGGPSVQNPRFARELAMATAAGAVLGALILGAAFLLPLPKVPIPSVPRWMGLLASFGAPVIEEVVFRLFAMTMVAWVLQKITGHRALSIVGGNVVAALAFGAAHLPQGVMLFGSMSPALLSFALVGNGLVALACGYLFWKKGFECAMALHFGADLVLHVLAKAG
jgi:hypothetical protein